MSYADQVRPQKPLSMAAAIALNGSIIAAIMLSPMIVNPPKDRDRTTATTVTPKPLPPPPDPQTKVEPRPLPRIYTPPPPFPMPTPEDQTRTITDPPPPNPGFVDGKGTGELPGLPEIIQKLPPPIFKAALRDPRFARDFQPDYPARLLSREIEGSATIRVLVGTDGRVRQASVVSATHPEFGAAAVKQALKAWRFKPATRGGTPVEDWVTLPVSFVIT
jgi:periplasmic protein TonB